MGLILNALLSSIIASAQTVPVYLKPNHPAPTGHFNKSELTHKTVHNEEFEWLWVKDVSGRQGWVLKSLVMLPLDFSRQAVLARNNVIFSKPTPSASTQRLERAQIVSLVKRQNEWYKIYYRDGKKNNYGWIKSRYLQPYSKDPGVFYSTATMSLRKAPQLKAPVVDVVHSGDRLLPIRLKKNWAYVQKGKKKGYLPIKYIKSRLDVAMKVRTPKGYFKPHKSLLSGKITEIFANPLWLGTGNFSVELKAQPSMSANNVTTLRPWQSLTMQGFSIKKWGKTSHMRNLGSVWWPIETVESNIELPAHYSKMVNNLSKDKIFQLVYNPKVKGLRFASTLEGVYRSFDGIEWYPLPGFRSGYPLTMTRTGTLFVGDKVSFDHGESFHEYIRWDKILDLIPKTQEKGFAPIQIIKVQPKAQDINKIKISMRMGYKRHVEVFTNDFGKSWTLL